MKKIGFIGGGAIAEAIIKGMLNKGTDKDSIYVSDISAKRLDYLKDTLNIRVLYENKEVVNHCEVIILSVKPQNLTEAVESFAGALTADKLLISILAGVTTERIEKLMPLGCKVIRVMPNTPALVGCGATVLAAGKGTLEEDLDVAKMIFEAVGSVTVLPEKMLNAVTGLSGSGPAYVYLIIEALADGGVLAGLPRDVALKLAAETVEGAGAMVRETKKHPGQLKDMVTSPAGTTIHGLLQLERAGVRGSIMETVLRSSERSEQLVKDKE